MHIFLQIGLQLQLYGIQSWLQAWNSGIKD